MKGEQRYDPTLDRTAKEAVAALSQQLADPVAREVVSRVGEHIDAAAVRLASAAGDLQTRGEALERAVGDLEGALTRRIVASVEEANVRAVERLSSQATSAAAGKVAGALDPLAAKIDAQRAELREKMDAVVQRMGSLADALAAAERLSSVAGTQAADKVAGALDALGVQLGAHQAHLRETGARLEGLEGLAITHRTAMNSLTERLDRAIVGTEDLRSLLALSERRRAQGLVILVAVLLFFGLAAAALLWKVAISR